MTETSATIIDFNAYRMNRRAAVKLSHDEGFSTALYEAVASYYFFWPFLALVPLGLARPPASEQGPSRAILRTQRNTQVERRHQSPDFVLRIVANPKQVVGRTGVINLRMKLHMDATTLFQTPEQLLIRLRDTLGSQAVLIGPEVPTRNCNDSSMSLPERPIAVVRPLDAAGVAGAIATCRTARLPSVPQGGLTGLCRGAAPEAGWVAISNGWLVLRKLIAPPQR